MTMSSRSCTGCGAANPPQATFCMACGESMEARASGPRNLTGLLLEDQLLKERYRILARIGQGGFAAVYKAQDLRLGQRLVAIKEMSQSGLSPQERSEAVDAFTREAQMLASLQHPHLPRIYDHFSEAGRWYLVMDFIEGETLEDALLHRPDHRFSLQETLEIGLQLCSVLEYLHTRRPPIIFRDLKPANILCSANKHLYLIDFGIARHFKAGQSKDTIAFGSPGYAAPEQYGKAQTTPQSDIYSLGVLLHHLLSGEDPSERPFFLSPLRLYGLAGLTELEALMTRMTQLAPEQRPRSVTEVQAELQAIAALSAGKRVGLQPLSLSREERHSPELSREGRRSEARQEQVLVPPENRSRRGFVIGGLVAGVALAAGAGSLLVLLPSSRRPKVHPTPSPKMAFSGPDAMFGVDAQHTHFNSAENILNPTNVSRLQIAWTSQSIGENPFSSPIASGDLVYVGSDDGRLYAFDAVSGQTRWVSDAHTSPFGSVLTAAVVNGIVYVCLLDRRLYAFDAASGQLRWTSPAGNAVFSSPIVVNGVVYVTDPSVYAFDAVSGQLRWVSSSTNSTAAAPAVANGLVYVVTSENRAGTGRVAALDASTGQTRWISDLISNPVDAGVDINSSPTVVNSLVYIGSGNGGLAAFDAATGHLRWVTPSTRGSTGCSPAVANGVVYLADDEVYAFDAATGKAIWASVGVGAYNSDSPLVANGVLYVGSASRDGAYVGSAYALDASTGHVLWVSPPLGKQLFTTPTVFNGVLYVAAREKVYAFHLPQK